MTAPQTQLLSVGELKFRRMISDLMTMEKPHINIQCSNSSKARSVRRCFYNWEKNLPEQERRFLLRIEYKVVGRLIIVAEKADWQPIEVSGESNVSTSQSVPT